MKRQYLLGIHTLIAGLCGFCGLVYQVVWHRTAEYNFGSDAIASAIAAGTLLLGLGLGAWLFEKWSKDAGKAHASIQLTLGIFGIVSFYLIAPAAAMLAQVFKPALDEMEGMRAAVVVSCILLLLPPSILIGGILPLTFRCFVQLLSLSVRTAGLIHGVIMLGASLAMLAVPLLFLNRLSLPGTLVIIGGLNIVIGCLLLWIRRLNAGQEIAHPAVGGAGKASVPRPLIYALAFISGFSLVGFAVSLLRALPIVNPSSAYNFPLVLVFLLLGIALGSIVFTRGVAEDRDAILYRTGSLMAASALGMFLGIWIASRLQANMYPISFMPILDNNGGSVFWVLVFSIVLIMPASFLSGAIVPLLLRLRAVGNAGLPESTGTVFLFNSLGGFCAVIIGRFAGFPMLGTPGFLTFIYLLGCVAGIGVMIWVWRRNLTDKPGRFSGALPAGMLAMSIMLAAIIPPTIWLTYITGGPEPNWEVREGASGVAQLWWEEDFGALRVNGQYMSQLPFHARHLKQEIFLLAQPRRETVLMLGLGGAEIIRSLVADDRIKNIDVVDSSYELPDLLAGGRAGEMLDHALASPRVRLFSADARVAADLYEPETFDVVFDNLAFASWAGASSFKSETYYRKIKRILKPDGVFVVSANYLSDSRSAVLAGLVRTFRIVKEHANGEIVIAVDREPEYSDAWIIEVVLPRAGEFGLNYSAPDALAAWFHNEQRPVTADQLSGVNPIRDDLLVHEYFWHPF